MVMTQRAAQNTVLPEVNDVITRRQPRRHGQTSVYDGRRWASWLGTKIGEGAYGSAFRCQVNDAAHRALEVVRAASTFWVEYRPVRTGSLVVVKITRDDSRSPVAQGTLDRFALDNIKEATLHKHLDEARCLNLGMAPLCVSNYVPDLYWAGLVVNQASGTRCYVTVMGVAPGIPVGKHLRRSRLDAETFLRIERAAAALWSQGVVHADLHKDNMMYDPATKKLTVIDFGFGVLLPPQYTVAVRNQLAKAVRAGVRSLGEMWLDSMGFGLGIQKYVNRVQRGRGVRWYYPDGHAAMMLYKRLPVAERRKVPDMRRSLWGLALSQQQQQQQRHQQTRQSQRQQQARQPQGRPSQRQRSRPASAALRLPRYLQPPVLPPQPRATAARVAAAAAVQKRRRGWLSRLRIPLVWQRRKTPVVLYPSPAAV